MDKKKVLITRIFPEIGASLLINAGFSVTSWILDKPMSQEELINKAQEFNALFCTTSEKIDKKFLNECKHLEIISQYAVGYDNIDIQEATKLGIAVTYTPGAMSDATADVAFGLMIATSRKMFYLHKKIINNKWDYFKPKANLGIELKNKTLGIYGLGRIGIEMAKRCKGAYNMNIIYHNRNRNEIAEKELQAEYVDYRTLLKRSDVISVHCSLNSETKGVFNKTAFSLMKPTAIFINTSRGGIHNEEDLIEALRQGEIWGAGLDVTNPEPMSPGNPLLNMENVSILPHIGSGTKEARNEMARMAANNIIDFYTSKQKINILNPEVLK